MVISEASRNTRYGTESVVKTAIRNAACSLAKLASNLLWNYRLEIGYAELKVPHKRVHTTRSLVGSLCFIRKLHELKVVE